MKKLHVFLFSSILIMNIFGAENAGITGMVNTNDIVESNGFSYPQQIHTVYTANDPALYKKTLVYVAYKKIGKHEPEIEISNHKNGKNIDKCSFTPTQVNELPWIETISCAWGGRQSDTGIVISVYDKFEGKKEKIGEMYLPAKRN